MPRAGVEDDVVDRERRGARDNAFDLLVVRIATDPECLGLRELPRNRRAMLGQEPRVIVVDACSELVVVLGECAEAPGEVDELGRVVSQIGLDAREVGGRERA